MPGLTDRPRCRAIPKSQSPRPTTAQRSLWDCYHPPTHTYILQNLLTGPRTASKSSPAVTPLPVVALDPTWSPHFLTRRGPGGTLSPAATRTLPLVSGECHTDPTDSCRWHCSAHSRDGETRTLLSRCGEKTTTEQSRVHVKSASDVVTCGHSTQ